MVNDVHTVILSLQKSLLASVLKSYHVWSLCYVLHYVINEYVSFLSIIWAVYDYSHNMT